MRNYNVKENADVSNSVKKNFSVREYFGYTFL